MENLIYIFLVLTFEWELGTQYAFSDGFSCNTVIYSFDSIEKMLESCMITKFWDGIDYKIILEKLDIVADLP